jgi:hypothetical protein
LWPGLLRLAFLLDIRRRCLYYTRRAELKTAGRGIFAETSFGYGLAKGIVTVHDG